MALAGLVGCGGGDPPSAAPPPPPVPGPEADVGTETEDEDTRQGSDRELARTDGAPTVKTVATGLEAPWEIAFLPDGRALITERPGRVRILSEGDELEPGLAARVPVATAGEGGLLGLAVDPDFERNDLVYLYRTTDSGNEVARYRLRGDRLEEEATILEGVKAGTIHDGGRIHFGPDNRLYVTTGDVDRPELAQDPDSLNGKFLRLEPAQYRGDGGRPEVFTLGHRNPQGFDWDPDSDRLLANEHGPVGFDEVNVLTEGSNYGWPKIQGYERAAGLETAIEIYDDSIAPSGATFVSLPGSKWTGDYLMGALVGRQIRRVELDGGRVTGDQPLFVGEFGRIRTVVEAPDGALYALTSNRDGRGAPTSEDDRVLRIVPPAS